MIGANSFRPARVRERNGRERTMALAILNFRRVSAAFCGRYAARNRDFRGFARRDAFRMDFALYFPEFRPIPLPEFQLEPLPPLRFEPFLPLLEAFEKN
jgi:hypothetical protein